MRNTYFDNITQYSDTINCVHIGLRENKFTRHFKLFCRLDIYAHRAMFGRNKAYKKAINAVFKLA